MSHLDKAVIARLKIKSHTFEIFVDLEKALKFREGKISDIRDVLVYEEIYKDAKKGERVSSDVLNEVFGTDDILEVASQIVKKGDIQITTEYRRKLIEQKRNQIIEILRRTIIDPVTKLPYTRERIEDLLEKVRVNIDPFKPAERQVDDIIKEIKKKVPIKVEYITFLVKIEYSHTKAIGLIKKKYKVLKEDWTDIGWKALIEVPTAIKGEFYDDIARWTNGEGLIEEKSKRS